jgi:Nucleotidyltransferase
VWAVHKLWLSRRADRQPIKRHCDAAQAEAVAALVASYLPFEAAQLHMVPKELVTDAAPLFVKTGTSRIS